MISKALFKQSCKANGVMWIIITFAVCFMLACVMLIAGGGNVSKVRNGIADTIVEGAMDGQIQKRADNYYSIVNNGLNEFERGYVGNPSNLNLALSNLNNYINEICVANNIKDDSLEKQELLGLMYGTLNLDLNQDGKNDFDEFYQAFNSEVTTYLQKPNSMIISEYAQNYSSVFLASNMVSETNVDKLITQLEKYSIDKEGFENLTYTIVVDGEEKNVSKYTGKYGYNYIKNLANESIVTYQAKLNYELSKITINPVTNPLQYKSEALKISQNLIENAGKSFLDSLPSDVSSSIEEVGEMDLFGLIIGSIFFKMAGLLLPIIYIIMVSNNLIAGQVDSGSMAYVLSTSTKRKQVVFTQALFLVSSLFAMFVCSTITSFICLAVINTSEITISYYDLGMLNLGAFITLFAMSGISFLASCWFNRSKHSMSIGGGLNMFFLVASMLGLFGSKVLPKIVRLDSLNFFNYCSIISLFDEVSILNGTTTFIWKLSILVAIGIICYFVGSKKFERKDLPL